MMPDDVLFNATESQLRNVLALARIPNTKLKALFKEEGRLSAKAERDEAQGEAGFRALKVVPIR